MCAHVQKHTCTKFEGPLADQLRMSKKPRPEFGRKGVSLEAMFHDGARKVNYYTGHHDILKGSPWIVSTLNVINHLYISYGHLQTS